MLELQTFVADTESAAREGRQNDFFDLNMRFHNRQLALAGNAPAETVYLAHTRKLLMLQRRSFDEASHMLQANSEHREVVDAILSGDAALVRERGERHGRSGRARFLKAIAYREA